MYDMPYRHHELWKGIVYLIRTELCSDISVGIHLHSPCQHFRQGLQEPGSATGLLSSVSRNTMFHTR